MTAPSATAYLCSVDTVLPDLLAAVRHGEFALTFKSSIVNNDADIIKLESHMLAGVEVVILGCQNVDSELITTLSEQQESTPKTLLILSKTAEIEAITEFAKSTLNGLLCLDDPAIKHKISSALRGDVVVSDSYMNDYLSSLRVSTAKSLSSRAREAIESLTKREHEVFQLLAEGKSNKLIARNLDISDGTVKVHVKRVLKKLNARSRYEAAMFQYR